MTDSTLTPSQEAREAAEVAFDDVLGDAGSYAEYMYPSYREGGVRTLAEAFARFEQAIRKDEAEKCAAKADEFAASSKPLRDTVDVARHDEAKLIAAAIHARHADTDQTGGK